MEINFIVIKGMYCGMFFEYVFLRVCVEILGYNIELWVKVRNLKVINLD